MATMNTVIEQVDALKPNAYTEEDKFTWISKLDSIISLEVMGMDEAITYEYPKDMDKALLIPIPYDEIYNYYVFAMIDFQNREYSNYNNSMLMFSERFDEYKKYYIRTHIPKSANNFRNIMG